jgi:hypothetical protein
MAIIAEFDTDPQLITMKEKHHAWHVAGGAHGFPSRQFPKGTPGSGHEFFQFHKDLINEFFAWKPYHAAWPRPRSVDRRAHRSEITGVAAKSSLHGNRRR